MSDDQALPPERLCTLWVHDDSFSKRPVIFNKALLASQGQAVQQGTLLKVVRVAAGVAVHDFQATDDPPKSAHSSDQASNEPLPDTVQPSGLQEVSQVNGARKHLVFVLEELDSDVLRKHPSLQVA